MSNEIDKINELQKQISYHQQLYYNAQPEISDKRFDELWDELKELDPANEVFLTVGKDRDVLLSKIKHIIPMGSQSKVSNHTEFNKWAK